MIEPFKIQDTCLHDKFCEITLLFHDYNIVFKEQIDEIKKYYTLIHKYYSKMSGGAIVALANITLEKCKNMGRDPSDQYETVEKSHVSDFRKSLIRELLTDQYTLHYLDINEPHISPETGKIFKHLNSFLQDVFPAASSADVAVDTEDLKILLSTK